MADGDYQYFTVGRSKDAKVAVIDEFEGIEDPWDLKSGVQMGARFGAQAEASLDPKRGSLLTDFLHNTDRVLPISNEMRSLFESEGLSEKEVEYLPFVLRNTRGRVVDEPRYCVANPLCIAACLDRDRSSISTFRDGVRIMSITKLCLVKDQIPEDFKLFRLEEQPKYILFRSDLVKAIEDAGLTGLNLTPEGGKL